MFKRTCTKWTRFGWIYNTNPRSITVGSQSDWVYSKLVMLLFGKYLLIENNDPVIFSEIYIWQSNSKNCFTEIFNLRLGSIVESGIYGYQNHHLEIFTQRKILAEFLSASRFNYSWNWVSFVYQLISKNTPIASYSSRSYQLSESLANMNEKDNMAVGKLYDFRYVWLFYDVCVLVLLFQFLLEVFWGETTLKNGGLHLFRMCGCLKHSICISFC